METLSFFVLIGKTGSGKTRILRYLKKTNLQILDLEEMTQNSGSVFGMHAHKNRTVSQKEFHDKLLLQMALLKPNVPILAEWKGKKLGALKIPDFLYARLISARKIEIDRCEKSRIEELKKTYQHLTIEQLYKSLFALRPKFTEPIFQAALEALKKKNKTKFIHALLHYYDSSAEYRLSQTNVVHKIDWHSQPIEEISQEINRLLYLKL